MNPPVTLCVPMHVTSITDPLDARLAPYLKLKDRAFEREVGGFLAEGEHVVRRAFEAGLVVQSVLVVKAKVGRVQAMVEADSSLLAGTGPDR